MNILVAVLLLGVIIIIHELGHFLLAKKNGVTVTEFSVGMGPRIAGFVKNGTRYSLKALPFGGSCMMLGEDESVEDEGAFGKKSVGARFSVISAGAFFNFILAFVLALVVIGSIGVDYPDMLGTAEDSPAASKGFQAGDRITGIDGKTIHFSKEIDMHFFFHPMTGDPVKISFIRNGEERTETITPEAITYYLLGFSYAPDLPEAQIGEIYEGYPMGEKGIAVGDIITAVDGTEIGTSTDLKEYFTANPLDKEPVQITYLHEGVENTVTVAPKEINEYSMGLQYNTSWEKTSAWETIKYSIYEIKYNIMYAMNSLGYLISGKANMNEIAGPVGIVNIVGKIVTQTKDEGIGIVLLNLASFSILLSTNLGVMNLLPIPALDGGRLVFLLLEAIRRKPVPKEKEAMVHMVGMAVLMIFMVIVLFNDIRNLF